MGSETYTPGGLTVVEGLELLETGVVADPETWNVFPNPAQGEVSVSLPSSWKQQRVIIRLIRMDGAMVQSWVVEGGNLHRLRLGYVVPGIYILQAVHQREAIQTKLMVR
ncbi:MAG: T9SS type A sorting domain-containing protein [Haliscomenobacter sp.]|nr:T9SS type A sorting domain-containing protein [Haliscomenobacter sp.]